MVMMPVLMFMPRALTMPVTVRLALLVLYAVFYVFNQSLCVHLSCGRNFNYLGVPVQVTHLFCKYCLIKICRTNNINLVKHKNIVQALEDTTDRAKDISDSIRSIIVKLA